MSVVAEQVRVPELRFPGFGQNEVSELSSFQLGQIGVTISGLTGKSKEDFGEGAKYVQYLQVFSRPIISLAECGRVQVVAGERQTQLNKGDVLFTISSESPAEIGMSSVLAVQPEEHIYLNSFCFGFRFSVAVVPEFTAFLFRSAPFRKSIAPLAQGSTRFNLSKSNFLKLKVCLPSFGEQEKIAGFLTAVDERIGKLKRKKELLEEYKRGMMQKLFSQEVRFKDENGRHYPDWEVRKLGELLLERVESGESESVMLSVTIKSGIRRFDELGRKDNSNPDKSKYKRIVAGDIAYNTLRLWQGASGLAQETGFVSPAYTVLRGDKSLVSMPFVSYWMKLGSVIFLFQRNSQGLTSDQWTCKYPVFSRIRWPFPSLEEQERIAEFLTGLDEKLDNLGQRIEKAEEFKRGLLQKMFV